MTRTKPPHRTTSARPPRPAAGPSPTRTGSGSASGSSASGGGPRASLLFGLHPVAAAWTNPERRCRRLLATEAGLTALGEALASARDLGLTRPAPQTVDRAELDRLLPTGAVHQGVVLDAEPLAEIDLDDLARLAESRPDDVVVVLDQVTDPHNVGAILRSAAAFGASAVVLTDRNAPELTGTLAKSASGAVEIVPLVRVVNLSRALSVLQEAGYWCVGLDETGTRTLAQLDLKGRVAVVMGAEGSGLRRLTRERCDDIARLPTRGPIGSLNVSNATAVALYELMRLRE